MRGRKGNDTIRNDTYLPATIYGDGGNDILSGGTAADWIYGGANDDQISGNDGNDVLFGNGGNNSLAGGRGSDSTIYEDMASYDPATGTVFVTGTEVADVLQVGDLERNIVVRRDGKEIAFLAAEGIPLTRLVLRGRQGDDTIRNDAYLPAKISGDAGNDTLIAGRANDVLFGGDNDDWLYAGPNATVMHGGDGNDTLLSATGLKIGDQFFGDAGNDVILGNRSFDVLALSGGKLYAAGPGGAPTLIDDAVSAVAIAPDSIATLYYLKGDGQLWSYTLDGGRILLCSGVTSLENSADGKIRYTLRQNLPNAVAGVAYSAQLDAAVGAANNRFELTSSIPAGFSLGSNGVLTGTTTTARSFSFSVRTTNNSIPYLVGAQNVGMTVVPDVIASVRISAPASVTSRQLFTVNVTAADRFGNAISTSVILRASNGQIFSVQTGTSSLTLRASGLVALIAEAGGVQGSTSIQVRPFSVHYDFRWDAFDRDGRLIGSRFEWIESNNSLEVQNFTGIVGSALSQTLTAQGYFVSRVTPVLLRRYDVI
jgi:hypothetical protein